MNLDFRRVLFWVAFVPLAATVLVAGLIGEFAIRLAAACDVFEAWCFRYGRFAPTKQENRE